jgi:hypothetical protein
LCNDGRPLHTAAMERRVSQLLLPRAVIPVTL